jgi:hypothetical protein
MAKGQKKSNREAKKPKKAAADKTSATVMSAFGGKISGTSYKDRFGKKTTPKG